MQGGLVCTRAEVGASGLFRVTVWGAGGSERWESDSIYTPAMCQSEPTRGETLGPKAIKRAAVFIQVGAARLGQGAATRSW